MPARRKSPRRSKSRSKSPRRVRRSSRQVARTSRRVTQRRSPKRTYRAPTTFDITPEMNAEFEAYQQEIKRKQAALAKDAVVPEFEAYQQEIKRKQAALAPLHKEKDAVVQELAENEAMNRTLDEQIVQAEQNGMNEEKEELERRKEELERRKEELVRKNEEWTRAIASVVGMEWATLTD